MIETHGKMSLNTGMKLVMITLKVLVMCMHEHRGIVLQRDWAVKTANGDSGFHNIRAQWWKIIL